MVNCVWSNAHFLAEFTVLLYQGLFYRENLWLDFFRPAEKIILTQFSSIVCGKIEEDSSSDFVALDLWFGLGSSINNVASKLARFDPLPSPAVGKCTNGT